MLRTTTRHRTLGLCLGGEAISHGEAKRQSSSQGFGADLLSNVAGKYRKYNIQCKFYIGNIVAIRLQR